MQTVGVSLKGPSEVASPPPVDLPPLLLLLTPIPGQLKPLPCILVQAPRATLWAVPGGSQVPIKQSFPSAPNSSCGRPLHKEDRAAGAAAPEEASGGPFPPSLHWEQTSANSRCAQQRAAAARGRPRARRVLGSPPQFRWKGGGETTIGGHARFLWGQTPCFTWGSLPFISSQGATGDSV